MQLTTRLLWRRCWVFAVVVSAWIPRKRVMVEEHGESSAGESAELVAVRAQLAETQFGYRRLVESLQEELAFYRARGSGPGGRFPIPRVNASSLTSALYLEHAASGIPLIVEGMESPFSALTVALLVEACGERAVVLKQRVADSAAWAELNPGRETTLGGFAAEVEAGPSKWYLHDEPLSKLCPEVEASLGLGRTAGAPERFGGSRNLLAEMPPNALHGNASSSWPSVFLGSRGSSSGLHTDVLQSHFWMRVLKGSKRWAVATRPDVPMLCPRKSAASSSDRFRATLVSRASPNCDTARSADVYEGVVAASEFIFVPSGSPHEVLNGATDDDDDATLAVSMNYCDASNAAHFAKAIRRVRHAGALGLLLDNDHDQRVVAKDQRRALEATALDNEAAFLDRLDTEAEAFAKRAPGTP